MSQPISRPTVPARLKYLPRRKYARILCGRPTSPEQFCLGDMGRVYAMPLEDTDTQDLDDSMSFAITGAGWVDDATSLSGELLSLGLRGAQPSDLTDLGDGDIGLWVAWHERAYRRLENGDYAVLSQHSLKREPWRVSNTGQSLGRGFLPDAMVNEIGDFNLNVHRGRGHPQEDRPPRQWRGIVGARPVLPAVIQCPRCQARNAVPRAEAAALCDVKAEIPRDDVVSGLKG